MTTQSASSCERTQVYMSSRNSEEIHWHFEHYLQSLCHPEVHALWNSVWNKLPGWVVNQVLRDLLRETPWRDHRRSGVADDFFFLVSISFPNRIDVWYRLWTHLEDTKVMTFASVTSQFSRLNTSRWLPFLKHFYFFERVGIRKETGRIVKERTQISNSMCLEVFLTYSSPLPVLLPTNPMSLWQVLLVKEFWLN
jgi:hypothetical protein